MILLAVVGLGLLPVAPWLGLACIGLCYAIHKTAEVDEGAFVALLMLLAGAYALIQIGQGLFDVIGP